MKHRAFSVTLPTQAVFQELMLSAKISFAPGLFDVLRSKAPPTAAFFRSLPLLREDLFAVYPILLEKTGHEPKNYIINGTLLRYIIRFFDS